MIEKQMLLCKEKQEQWSRQGENASTGSCTEASSSWVVEILKAAAKLIKHTGYAC